MSVEAVVPEQREGDVADEGESHERAVDVRDDVLVVDFLVGARDVEVAGVAERRDGGRVGHSCPLGRELVLLAVVELCWVKVVRGAANSEHREDVDDADDDGQVAVPELVDGLRQAQRDCHHCKHSSDSAAAERAGQEGREEVHGDDHVHDDSAE